MNGFTSSSSASPSAPVHRALILGSQPETVAYPELQVWAVLDSNQRLPA